MSTLAKGEVRPVKVVDDSRDLYILHFCMASLLRTHFLWDICGSFKKPSRKYGTKTVFIVSRTNRIEIMVFLF